MKEKPGQKTEAVEKVDVTKEENQNDAYWLNQFGISIGKKQFWGSDKFLSLFAFLISVGTFTTFAYQTYLIQKQQYANVLPYLSINFGHGYEYFRIDVTNNGVGPAFIQHVAIHHKDSIYNMDLSPFAYQMVQPDSSIRYDISSSSLPKGYAIPSKGSVLVIGSNNRETGDLLKEVFFKDNTEIKITYSSVFDERWRVTSESFVPERIEIE